MPEERASTGFAMMQAKLMRHKRQTAELERDKITNLKESMAAFARDKKRGGGKDLLSCFFSHFTIKKD